MDNTQIEEDFDGSRAVRAVLNSFGRRVELMPQTYCGFDFLMDGKIKVELKTARPSIDHGNRVWRFNIHRHNKMTESLVDLYIFRFEGIPYSKKAIHALFYPPLNRKTINFSDRQLLEGAIAEAVKAFRALKIDKQPQRLTQGAQDNGKTIYR